MVVTRGFVGRRTGDRLLPPGQYDVGDDWPVLTAEVTPNVRTDSWTITVDGLVDTPVTWTWDEMLALPQSDSEHLLLSRRPSRWELPRDALAGGR